ncbi:MAG: hypothetical protein HOE45_09535 [Gammaproteobacteria bacterium]|jgi:hypothetical protein|nr:hypothetical protein [Gammaproteobacteria bacterium]MBT4147094.1 hypothetical protein [Gammaproteobacteria bacterium]MBT5222067.1 hypothetical protein [Gammaproteobacteria bacterium]MBT5825656.1 hypothetical protein [Gammaproteobacteria bacterium]MBT5967309.1 hypothetical protein [Gammaproteobacteria bacterium]
MIKEICVLFLCCFSLGCLAEENLESVMLRMKPETAVQIAYQETRSMGLFDNDWEGSGYLYAAVPNAMLKQQINPDIELMAAEGNQLSYSKPASHTFQHTQLDESNPMMASLIAFKAMLTGNLVILRQRYQLKFSTTETLWRLEMTANEPAPDEQPLKIIMQGLSEQAANRMEMILPDGDRSLYVLSKPQEGLAIQQHMQKLLQTLKSQ